MRHWAQLVRILKSIVRNLSGTAKMKSKPVLVTGGLGFIGKHFVRRCLELGHFVTNADIVNYAADRFVNIQFKEHHNYRHLQTDVANVGYLPECDVLVNFGAEC
jgi:dTDP-glucose 4,6-dehydratase